MVEMARCLLKSMRVPSIFWGEAVRTAVYILNRSPTKALNKKTPYEAWHGKKPKVSHLRIFGCVAHVKRVGPGINKLADRSSKMVFIGYESGTKGYMFFDPATNKLVVSRDVVFEEGKPWDWDSSKCSTNQQENDTFIVHYDLTDQNMATAVFKQQMMKRFNMCDLGLLSYYLGLQVKQKPGEITICQSAYAEKILENCGMQGCNPVDTPMEQHLKLLPGKPELILDATKYRSLVGSLRYLVNTRPDLAFSVGMVSRFMETPNAEHWTAIKRIIRFVAGTIQYGCKYSKGADAALVGYSDSDHAGDLERRKSTSGIVFFLGNNVITWCSQKQRVVSLSNLACQHLCVCCQIPNTSHGSGMLDLVT